MMECLNSNAEAGLQQSVTLCDLKTITESLASILIKSFGPRGTATLLVSSTGQASVVKDGLETLSCLYLSHPIAKSILLAVKNHSDAYGDGCKTMVIYMNALFCALERKIHKRTSGGNDLVMKNQMAKTLRAFISDEIPSLLLKVEKFFSSRTQKAMEHKNVSWVLFHVISSYLNGCVPHSAVQPVAEMIVQYLNGDSSSLNDCLQCLQWSSSCIHVISNEMYQSSHVASGVFLLRPLIYENQSIRKVNMICLLGSLPGTTPKEEDKDICLLEDPEKILQHSHQAMTKFLSMLKDKSISLLLTNSRLQPFVLQLCQFQGLAIIDCLEESDIDFICHITRKAPVTSRLEDITSDCLIKVVSCTQLVRGQSSYSEIILEEEGLIWNPRTMFLCAPSQDSCKQVKKVIEKCMKLSSHLLGSRNYGNVQSVTDDKTVIGQVLNNVICGGGCFEMVLCNFLNDCTHEIHSAAQQSCCTALIEMLSAVPQVLNLNATSHQKQRIPEFFGTLKSTKRKLEQDNAFCGINANGELCNPMDLGILEVLSVKIATFHSALWAASSLLNVEAILSVSKSKPQDPV